MSKKKVTDPKILERNTFTYNYSLEGTVAFVFSKLVRCAQTMDSKYKWNSKKIECIY